jgi:hypothetical protein
MIQQDLLIQARNCWAHCKIKISRWYWHLGEIFCIFIEVFSPTLQVQLTCGYTCSLLNLVIKVGAINKYHFHLGFTTNYVWSLMFQLRWHFFILVGNIWEFTPGHIHLHGDIKWGVTLLSMGYCCYWPKNIKNCWLLNNNNQVWTSNKSSIIFCC